MTKQPQAPRTLYKKLAKRLSQLEPYYGAWRVHIGVVMHALLDVHHQKAWERTRKPKGWDKTWRVIVNQGVIGALAILLNAGPPAVLGQFIRWAQEVGHKSLGEFVSDLHIAKFPRYVGDKDNPWAPLFRGRSLGDLMDARGAFEHGGWKLLQMELLLALSESRIALALRRLLSAAILESLIFERFGFVISRCQHGDHWFASDDRRRKDCVAHRIAGQQARWRQRHPGWKLRRQESRATVSAER